MITKIPIHVQASKELSQLETSFSKKSAGLNGNFRRPNPFVSNAFESNTKFTGTKVVEGDSKTQFRIRPQTPKLDMILLQKAKRKQLSKIEPLPVKVPKLKPIANKVSKKKIKI